MKQVHVPLKEYYKAYYDFRKHCRNSKQQLKFEINYARNIKKIKDQVINKHVDLGISHAFIVRKPKPREIFAGSITKRLLDWLCIEVLKPCMANHFSRRQFNVRKGFGLTLYHEQIQLDMYNRKDDWIFGGDVKSFFMTMNKNVVWNMWLQVINDWYDGKYRLEMLYLLYNIIYYAPEKNCVRYSSIKDWELVPDYKSLFKNGDNFGMPIGDLISLYTALLLLRVMAVTLERLFYTIGIYMDDFYIIAPYNKILDAIEESRVQLSSIGMKLNENKTYIQSCRHGIKTCGAFIYGNRRYVSNRIVQTTYKALFLKSNLQTYCNSLNSYFGALRHFKTYNIRKKLVELIPVDLRQQIRIINYEKFRENG